MSSVGWERSSVQRSRLGFLISQWRALRDRRTITLAVITATVLTLAVIPASLTTRARLPLGLAMLTAALAVCTAIITHRSATTDQPRPGEDH